MVAGQAGVVKSLQLYQLRKSLLLDVTDVTCFQTRRWIGFSGFSPGFVWGLLPEGGTITPLPFLCKPAILMVPEGYICSTSYETSDATN